jgi:hypothetical protein
VFEGGRATAAPGANEAREHNGTGPDEPARTEPEPVGVTSGGPETSASADDLPF